jgi:hypothetical protein
MNDLLAAAIFTGFPHWKSVTFQKEMTPKILRFEVTAETGTRPLYLTAIISKEEKMAWQSFQDVLDHTMTLAQSGVRGFFGFDVLSVDLQQGMQNFNPRALSQLIINHARELGPDQKGLVRYGQLFALLHYRAPANWGKIEVKTHVDFFSQAAASAEVTEASVLAALKGSGSKNKNSSGDQLDLLLKKFLKESGQEPGAIYMLHDLSVHPVWDPSHQVQQQRVWDWLEKEKQARSGSIPDVFLCHSAAQALLEFSRHL